MAKLQGVTLTKGEVYPKSKTYGIQFPEGNVSPRYEKQEIRLIKKFKEERKT